MKFKEYRIDIWILLPVLALILFSVGSVYSASSYFSMSKFNDQNYMLKLHLIRVILAIIMLFVFAKVDYRYYKKYGKLIIWISILFLAIIYLGLFTTINGATRWISIGPFSFQPSDLAKFTLIIYISNLLVKKKEYLHFLYRGYYPLLFYIVLVTLLVAFQPNFSTSIIIFGTSILLLFISRVKFKHLAFTVLVLIPFVILYVISKSYIVDRITSHSDYTAGSNPNYQLTQSIIGFGNGGFTGVGIGNSYQREFFLPEAYGDFIFSIIGEEYGFIGTFIIIILFVLLMYRGYSVTKTIKDEYGRYLSFGITTIISAYAFVNMAVASGLAPTTGVPVPFISYGGTALIINSMAIGILLNISSFRNNDELFFLNNEPGKIKLPQY
jgi:cell division protein FtsW